MKRTLTTVLFIVLFALTSTNLFAQSDLQIFGFAQSTLNKIQGGVTSIADIPTPLGIQKKTLSSSSQNLISAQVQQLNLFFRKELNENFTAWINFEVLNSYNTNKKWGSFSIEEAWVNYQSSDAFNLKVGLLIPRFGYFNEIKNRMPLIPYISRPFVFEVSNPLINPSDYTPQRAYAQISGYLPVGTFTLDYAAFFGNTDDEYVTGNAILGGNGIDTTNFKLFGGRIGLKTGELSFGFSGAIDKDNHQSDLKEDVPRTRLAMDLNYSVFNFFLDAEYISVNLDTKNTSVDYDKSFYYGTLGYNFTNDLFAYCNYGFLKDGSHPIRKGGVKSISFGGGYKIIESVVLKASYTNYSADNAYQTVIDPKLPAVNAVGKVDYKLYQLAISVLF